MPARTMMLLVSLVCTAIVAIDPTQAAATDMDDTLKREDHSCGTTVYEDIEGVFTTPNYPMHYGNNMNCTYKFEVPGNGPHYVHFHACDCELEDCFDCDYLIFGINRFKYSGEITGYILEAYAEGGQARVEFRSNGNVTRKGCKLGYSLFSYESAQQQCLGHSQNLPVFTDSYEHERPYEGYTTAGNKHMTGYVNPLISDVIRTEYGALSSLHGFLASIWKAIYGLAA